MSNTEIQDIIHTARRLGAKIEVDRVASGADGSMVIESIRLTLDSIEYFSLPMPAQTAITLLQQFNQARQYPALIERALTRVRKREDLLSACHVVWHEAQGNERVAVNQWFVLTNHSFLKLGSDAETRFRLLVDVEASRGCYGCGRGMLEQPIDALYCKRCRPTTDILEQSTST